MALALAWIAWRAPAHHLPRRRVLYGVWLIAGGALLAGRLGYVAQHPAYFAQRGADMGALRRVGGMHGSSALAGGALVASLWAWRMRYRWRDVIALFAPAALCVAAGGWWSCWDWGCAWGRAAHNAPPLLRWMVRDAPNLYHENVPRYAVQLWSGLWAAALMIVSARFATRAPLALIGYALGIAGLTLLRGDPAPTLGPLRWDVWLNLSVAAGLGGITWWTRPGRAQSMTEERGTDDCIDL